MIKSRVELAFFFHVYFFKPQMYIITVPNTLKYILIFNLTTEDKRNIHHAIRTQVTNTKIVVRHRSINN